MSTSHPSCGAALQSAKPGLHEPMVHDPDTHDAVPLALGQGAQLLPPWQTPPLQVAPHMVPFTHATPLA